MKKILWAIIFSNCVCAFVWAQSPYDYPQNVYISRTGRVRSSQEVEAMKSLVDTQRRNQRFAEMQAVTDRNLNPERVYVSTTSRSLSYQAKKYLAPSDALQTQYKSFLESTGTGIIKLLPAKLCAGEDGKSKKKNKLSKLIEECPFSFVQGNGKYFSFRQKEYVDYALSDIGFQDKWIFSMGSLNQGILVGLGDVNLEDVSLTAKGVDYLADFKPAPTIEGAAKDHQQFEDGLKVGDFNYQKIVEVEKNKTYAVRVVAYNPYYPIPESYKTGKSASKSDKSSANARANPTKIYSFGNDVRQDVIVAFRVIEKEEDGSIVLLWKELRRESSPELLIPGPVLKTTDSTPK